MFVGLERSFNSAELITTSIKHKPEPIKKEKKIYEKEGISGVVTPIKFDPLTGRVTVLVKTSSPLELQTKICKIIQQQKETNMVLRLIKQLIEENSTLCTKKVIFTTLQKEEPPLPAGRSPIRRTVSKPLFNAKHPVALAIEKGHALLVSYFLDLCEDRKWIVPPATMNILHYACKSGNHELVKIITAKSNSRIFVNINIDDRESNGYTALMLASINGDHLSVRELLQFGADWMLEEPRQKRNAIYMALYRHHTKVIEAFIELRKINLTTIRDRAGNLILQELLYDGHAPHLYYLTNSLHITMDKELASTAHACTTKYARKHLASPPFLSVPDLMAKIVQFLGYRELCSLSQVSQSMRVIAQDPSFWKALYTTRWPNLVGYISSLDFTWKQLFRDNYVREKVGLVPCTPRPIWIHDRSVVGCHLCEIPFAFFTRRHHCRMCGMVVCGTCCQHTAPLPALQYYDPVKICDLCNARLSNM